MSRNDHPWFTWISKRKAALDCLIRARGNARRAAELSKKWSLSVSHGYMQELTYAEKYRPFREEYHRRTGKLLKAIEVDTEFVIKGLVELTRPDMPPSTRRQALRYLGNYLGIWAPKKKEAQQHEATTEKIRRVIEEETDPERKRWLTLLRLSRTSFDELGLFGRIGAGLHSNEEFARFLKRYLGVRIPDKRICADHQAPFSFVADLFMGRVADAVVCGVAGREESRSTRPYQHSLTPAFGRNVILALCGRLSARENTLMMVPSTSETTPNCLILASEPTESETLLKNG